MDYIMGLLGFVSMSGLILWSAWTIYKEFFMSRRLDGETKGRD